MTQFILNIPTEKVQQFLITMTATGFANTIKNVLKEKNYNSFNLLPLNNDLRKQHPYFDSDFFANDIFY
ncbi:MAG: hypothetical protein IT251_05665 [Chitinophagaceae bacterium]|nr:hypothetical protein [Chitinophagaceae bacterium]